MRKLIVFLFVCILSSVTLQAQQQNKQQDKWEVFGGYTYAKAYFANHANTISPLSLNGGQFAVTYYGSKHIGLTADFSSLADHVALNNAQAFSGAEFRNESFLFGPTARFGFPGVKSQRVSLFAHQLFGVSRVSITPDYGDFCNATQKQCKATPFTMNSGGGMDLKVSAHVSVRPFQMDYWSQKLSMSDLMKENTGGENISTDGFRYSAGVVYNF